MIIEIEITNNPHNFIAFLTLSMSISYALFINPRFGLGKLPAILLIVIPMGLIAYERHHVIDMGLGFIIGTLFAKGIIDTSQPLAWLTQPFYKFYWRLQQSKAERTRARAQAQANQNYQDFREQEAQRQQEQARREREEAKAQQK